MLRGVYRKWKQPIHFQYVQGAVKSVQLVRTIKEIIEMVIASGFIVLGTICDQGANNASAINYLIKEAQNNYLRKGDRYSL